MNGPFEKNDGGIASTAGGAAAPAVLTPMTASAALTPLLQRLSDYVELAKPRISTLVLLVTAAGFCLGHPGELSIVLLIHALVGTALVAVAANVLNQYMERDFDRLMRRTANRPMPAGRLRPAEAAAFGVASALAGLAYLYVLVNALSAILALVTIALYLFAYTPLKRRTALNTLVGAVPGALPPMIGFAAAGGRLDATAWILFAILYVWQLPHFFAIAWIYREDYARGGYRMLSFADSDGRRTGRWIVLTTMLLIAVSLLPTIQDGHAASAVYAFGAILLGAAMLAVGIGAARQPTTTRARWVLLASVAYLPGLMILLLLARAS